MCGGTINDFPPDPQPCLAGPQEDAFLYVPTYDTDLTAIEIPILIQLGFGAIVTVYDDAGQPGPGMPIGPMLDQSTANGWDHYVPWLAGQPKKVTLLAGVTYWIGVAPKAQYVECTTQGALVPHYYRTYPGPWIASSAVHFTARIIGSCL